MFSKREKCSSSRSSLGQLKRVSVSELLSSQRYRSQSGAKTTKHISELKTSIVNMGMNLFRVNSSTTSRLIHEENNKIVDKMPSIHERASSTGPYKLLGDTLIKSSIISISQLDLDRTANKNKKTHKKVRITSVMEGPQSTSNRKDIMAYNIANDTSIVHSKGSSHASMHRSSIRRPGRYTPMNSRFKEYTDRGYVSDSMASLSRMKKPGSVNEFMQMQTMDRVKEESCAADKDVLFDNASGDIFLKNGVAHDANKFKQQIIDAEEDMVFKEELRNLSRQDQHLKLATSKALNKQKLSLDHHGQKQYFNLALENGNDHIKVTLANCNELTTLRRLDDARLKSVKQELDLKADKAIAYAKASRMILKSKYNEWRRNRWVKLNNDAYKHKPVKCLAHILRKLYLKFLSMNLHQSEVSSVNSDLRQSHNCSNAILQARFA